MSANVVGHLHVINSTQDRIKHIDTNLQTKRLPSISDTFPDNTPFVSVGFSFFSQCTVFQTVIHINDNIVDLK